MGAMSDWRPDSWQTKTAAQQATYPDPERLRSVVASMGRLPPLVTSWEIEALKANLAKAARGEAFVLQGGDCAESFEECSSANITAKLKILLQMSLVLVHGSHRPVVRVGRIAGQYAKPRSSDFETREGVTLHAYRGDNVNRPEFTEAARRPDPELLLRGYERAALTLNFIRSLVDGGFADIQHPEYWDITFAKVAKQGTEYERIVEAIRESLSFTRAVTGSDFADLRRIDFFTSHEGLSLHYEEAQTHKVPRREGYYDLSTHFPWIGMRTAQLDGAHVEFFRGIRNPIAIKIGAAMTEDWLAGLLEALNPTREPGRITLIHRVGAEKVGDVLPRFIEWVDRANHPVLWVCDPMHGNTETTADGIKTRRFDKILHEVEAALDVHRRMGTVQGGVHFELTGENVTECIGGSTGIEAEDLKRDYRTKVDPRLNADQALEMAMLIASRARRSR
jgi:3-deoxy-7-phosphoheptulonate synthase